MQNWYAMFFGLCIIDGDVIIKAENQTLRSMVVEAIRKFKGHESYSRAKFI